jgi:O-antigen ligase
MRVYLAYLLTAFLAAYAWRDWFPAAAGLVLLMAGINHPDMPHEVLGVPGLNLWNVLLLATLPAWLAARRREGLTWDLPPPGTVLLLVYAAIICVSFVRLVLDPGPVTIGASDLVGEYILNPLKFLLPAVMFFDGARTRSRQYLGLLCILMVYVALAVLVIKWVPLSQASSGGEMVSRGLRRLSQETGLHKNSLSVMLAGACWAVLAARPLVRSRTRSLALFGLAGLLALAMALTGGRGGYLAWACVGLVLSVLRWRVFLVLGPLAVTLLIALAPGVAQRAVEGIAVTDDQSESVEVDREEVSAGRLTVWPYMLDKIKESPLVGFGRLGYQRSGLYAFLVAEVDDTFPHPHNAFLEWLLDNGWVGMMAMLLLYGSVLVTALILFVDSRHPLFTASGGVAFALLFAHVVGSATGRTWYPNEETVTMWAAVGLMLRVWVERSRGGTPGVAP